MDGATMLSEFRLGFDVIASNAAPGFTDTEIYSLLNRGQDYIILDLYKQRNFELLQSLIKEGAIAFSSSSEYRYGVLPIDYWLYITLSVIAIRTAATSTGFIPSFVDNSGSRVDCDLIDPKEALQFLASPFNRYRIWKNPKAYLEGNYIRVIMDNFSTTSSGNLTYIKKRASISNSVSCELQESLHRLVVDKAIDIAKTIINIQEPQSTSK